jgi:MurNAc alpha-1-phosphate uridylyltransferase
VHYFADRLEQHLKGRRRPEIVISDERAELLETGGGLKKARSLLGDDPVWVANIDSVWTERRPAMKALAQAWDPDKMDVALLLAPLERSLGFEGMGDAFLDDNGRLRFRGGATSAPFAYMGVHITKPQIVDEGPDGPFSLSPIWRRLSEEGRVHGVVMDGFWMHVGDPVSRDAAENKLRAEAA